MRTTAIDSDDGVLRRITGAAILAIPLAFILGWRALAFGLPALIFPWALGKAGRVVDLARTPVSFCLPGFRESLRRRCFLAGMIAGVAMSLFPVAIYMLMHFEGWSGERAPLRMVLSVAAAFPVGMVIALIVASWRFIFSRREKNLIFLFSIPLFLGAVVTFSAFIEYAFVGIPFCAAACFFVWARLGDMRRVREGHRAILTDVLEERVEGDASHVPSSLAPDLSLEWMAAHWRLTERGYIAKGLYGVLAPIVRYRIWIFTSVIVGVVVLGLAGRWFTEVLFLASGLLVLAAPLPIPFDGLWLPLGRRERGLATITVVVAVFLLLEGGTAIVAVGTWVLAAVLSAFDVPWYTGIAGSDLCLPGVLVPWLIGWRLLRIRWPRVAGVIGVALGVIETGVLIFLFARGASSVRSVGVVLLAPALIAGWPVFLLTLWDVCKCGDLIEPPDGTEVEE